MPMIAPFVYLIPNWMMTNIILFILDVKHLNCTLDFISKSCYT